MTLLNIVSGEGSVLWEWSSPSGRKSLSVGLAPALDSFGLNWGVLGAGGVERNSRGGVVVLTHTCREGLCVIPLVLERDREELQFSKRSGAALMEIPKCGELRMCHSSLAPWLCWIPAGPGVLRARPWVVPGCSWILSWVGAGAEGLSRAGLTAGVSGDKAKTPRQGTVLKSPCGVSAGDL